MSSTASRASPYVEDDPTAPDQRLWRSKLAGEQAVLAEHDNSAVLRTAWVYSPFGANFVKTMLRLAESATRSRSSPTSAAIRPARSTSPTAFWPSRRILRRATDPIAARRLPHDRRRRGELGRFRRGDLRASAGARRPDREGEAHLDRRLSDAGAAPGQFAARLRRSLARVHGVRLPDWRSIRANCRQAPGSVAAHEELTNR